MKIEDKLLAEICLEGQLLAAMVLKEAKKLVKKRGDAFATATFNEAGILLCSLALAEKTHLDKKEWEKAAKTLGLLIRAEAKDFMQRAKN